jgi:release factor glutamine methyltransferase
VHSATEGLARPIVVDLCAGSGAIGLSVAHENARAIVHLVERSSAAFEWLERNASSVTGRDGTASSRIQLHHADLAEAPSGLDGTVDVVVANPPYVPLDEQDLVDPEVRDHDPAEALWAEDDGLSVIRRVVERAVVLLRPGGSLVVEHSERHEHSVPELLFAAGFAEISDHPDLAGRPRFSVGVTRC